MSYAQEIVTRLACDLCPSQLSWHGHLSRASAEKAARGFTWRKDKLGRNVCPKHPKLKGARR